VSDAASREVISAGEFTLSASNRIHMDGKRMADGALSTMPKRLGFQGGILTSLTFVECLKKLLLAFKMFDRHPTSIKNAGKKWKLFFTLSLCEIPVVPKEHDKSLCTSLNHCY
jgi:hypothetical protein